jgi:hypothetical protein
LKSGEQKTLFVDFNIPFYAEIGVSSATLKIEGNNISQEKVFGLSIFEKSENITEKSPTTGLVTGFTLPEINYMDVVSIIIFAVICFSVAIIMKKRRIRKSNKEKIKNTLFNIRDFIGTEDSATGGRTQSSNPYDKLILTEFPNFLELSKKLINNKFMGEDDGKDN